MCAPPSRTMMNETCRQGLRARGEATRGVVAILLALTCSAAIVILLAGSSGNESLLLDGNTFNMEDARNMAEAYLEPPTTLKEDEAPEQHVRDIMLQNVRSLKAYCIAAREEAVTMIRESPRITAIKPLLHLIQEYGVASPNENILLSFAEIFGSIQRSHNAHNAGGINEYLLQHFSQGMASPHGVLIKEYPTSTDPHAETRVGLDETVLGLKSHSTSSFPAVSIDAHRAALDTVHATSAHAAMEAAMLCVDLEDHPSLLSRIQAFYTSTQPNRDKAMDQMHKEAQALEAAHTKPSRKECSSSLGIVHTILSEEHSAPGCPELQGRYDLGEIIVDDLLVSITQEGEGLAPKTLTGVAKDCHGWALGPGEESKILTFSFDKQAQRLTWLSADRTPWSKNTAQVLQVVAQTRSVMAVQPCATSGAERRQTCIVVKSSDDKQDIVERSAAVRCCSFSGSECQYIRTTGARVGECFGESVSFGEAEGICSREGYRLCSQSELNSGKCCGGGCGDTTLAWTKSDCTPDPTDPTDPTEPTEPTEPFKSTPRQEYGSKPIPATAPLQSPEPTKPVPVDPPAPSIQKSTAKKDASSGGLSTEQEKAFEKENQGGLIGTNRNVGALLTRNQVVANDKFYKLSQVEFGTKLRAQRGKSSTNPVSSQKMVLEAASLLQQRPQQEALDVVRLQQQLAQQDAQIQQQREELALEARFLQQEKMLAWQQKVIIQQGLAERKQKTK